MSSPLLARPPVPLRPPCIAALVPTLTLRCNGAKAGACCSLTHHCVSGGGGDYERLSGAAPYRFLVSTRGSSASHAVFGLDTPRNREQHSPPPRPRRLCDREGSVISGAERVDADKDLEATGTGMEAMDITMREGSSKQAGGEVMTTVAAAAAVGENSSEERGRDGGERGRRPILYPPRFGEIAGLRPWTEGWTKQSLGAQVGFGFHTHSEGEREEADLLTILCTPLFDDHHKCTLPFGDKTLIEDWSKPVEDGSRDRLLCFIFVLFSILLKTFVSSVFDLRINSSFPFMFNLNFRHFRFSFSCKSVKNKMEGYGRQGIPVSGTFLVGVPVLPRCRVPVFEVLLSLPKCQGPVLRSYRTYRTVGYWC